MCRGPPGGALKYGRQPKTRRIWLFSHRNARQAPEFALATVASGTSRRTNGRENLAFGRDERRAGSVLAAPNLWKKWGSRLLATLSGGPSAARAATRRKGSEPSRAG